MPTKIPYADEVWNPVVGCTKIKSGCKFCWAERLHDRRHLAWFAKLTDWTTCPKQYWLPFSEVQLLPQRLDQPLHWRKPRTIFVCSMSDIFHKDVPFEFINKLWGVMMKAPQHTYLLFTKRWQRCKAFMDQLPGRDAYEKRTWIKDVHLFFSVSTQAEVDEAVPILLQIPAAKCGLSLEPLLGRVNFCLKNNGVMIAKNQGISMQDWNVLEGTCGRIRTNCLDSVIVGSESGPNRRPCELDWIRSIVEQCQAAGVAPYVKQIPIDGKVITDPKLFPEKLRVRESPK